MLTVGGVLWPSWFRCSSHGPCAGQGAKPGASQAARPLLCWPATEFWEVPRAGSTFVCLASCMRHTAAAMLIWASGMEPAAAWHAGSLQAVKSALAQCHSSWTSDIITRGHASHASPVVERAAAPDAGGWCSPLGPWSCTPVHRGVRGREVERPALANFRYPDTGRIAMILMQRPSPSHSPAT